MDGIRKQLANDISVNFFKTFRLFRQDVSKLFEEYIPWNEFIVLRILSREQREMVSRVACELEVSSSHITAVAEKLINKSLLTRSRCETDRRIVYLEITEKGKRLVEEMEEKKQAYFQSKFADFTEEEMQTIILLLNKIT
ncbi:MarR family winged helix-turn-helix transcriptional regulator [Microbacteriaceae bacterium 4G12]